MIKEVHITQMKEKLEEDPTARFYVVIRKSPEYILFDQIQGSSVLASSTEIKDMSTYLG